MQGLGFTASVFEVYRSDTLIALTYWGLVGKQGIYYVSVSLFPYKHWQVSFHSSIEELAGSTVLAFTASRANL